MKENTDKADHQPGRPVSLDCPWTEPKRKKFETNGQKPDVTAEEERLYALKTEEKLKFALKRLSELDCSFADSVLKKRRTQP